MKNLGISHAISISGLHLALVYSILKRIFGVKLSLVIAFAYVLFTGHQLRLWSLYNDIDIKPWNGY